MSVPAQIGRYRILGVLGQGAMGTVYRGRDATLDRDVAIKVISVGKAAEGARERFIREGKAAGRLQHPNIVTIYELGEHEGAPFMALELLEGTDLQRAIEAGIRPDPKVTLPIVLQALAGLGHAHENGIIHRDVKPSNVFLPRGRPAKIMDFGVARLADNVTTKNMVVGTPNYMSPEQVRTGDLDGRSDLFSVGLILYELVTGEKAYQGDTVVALLYKIANEDPDLGIIPKGPRWERLRGVIARALRKKREERYADARAMSLDLQDALKELGGGADWMTPSDQALLGRGRAASPRASAAARTPLLSPAPPPPDPQHFPEPQASPTKATRARAPVALAGTVGVAALALGGLAFFFLTRPAVKPPPSPSPSAIPTAVAAATPAPGPAVSQAPPTTVILPAPSPLVPPAAPAASSPPPTPLPSASPVLSAGPPVEARLDRANDLMDKGRYAQALAEAKAVLAREPSNAAAQLLAQDAEAAILVEEALKKARAALKDGDREGALVEIRRGLAVNPSEGRLLALFREATQ